MSGPRLRDRLTQLIASGFGRLVVDLDEVDHVDSSGLCALVGSLREARIAGGDVRIARPVRSVRDLLHGSMLDAILTPYTSVGDALVGL